MPEMRAEKPAEFDGKDLFGKGADPFGKGAPIDLFGKGGADPFGKGAPIDLFGKGADPFGKGAADLFGKGVDLFSKGADPFQAPEKADAATAPAQTQGFGDMDAQTLQMLGLSAPAQPAPSAPKQEPAPSAPKQEAPPKVAAAVSADGSITREGFRGEDARWLAMESSELSALMQDAPPDAPILPRAEANASILNDWAAKWAVLFPDAADALLPGLATTLHAAVRAAAPASTAAWPAVRRALQTHGRGCWTNVQELCRASTPMSCLVLLTAKGSDACHQVLAPSVFMACMGELPACSVQHDAALACLNASASPTSDCGLALEKVQTLQAELPTVLAHAFGQLRQEPRGEVGLLHGVPLLIFGLAGAAVVVVLAWLFRQHVTLGSSKENGALAFVPPNNFFVTLRLHRDGEKLALFREHRDGETDGEPEEGAEGPEESAGETDGEPEECN